MQDFFKKLVNRSSQVSEPEPVVDEENKRENIPEPVTYSPKTLKDFLQVIKNTPLDVLSEDDRSIIASAISFRDRKVESIMLPKNKITFVFEHDFLGPLMLDQLYKSGYSHFPVLSSDGHYIVGLLHTDQLNSLEIRNTERASTYVDKTVFYLRNDYTLEQAMAAFLRTNSFFHIVVNQNGQIVGLLTYKMLISHLLGYEPKDDFKDDSNLAAIMKRDLRG